MFPISLQPNWAEGRQNSTCLCLAHFTFPNIYLSLHPVFIIRKVTQAWAETGLRGRTHERLIPNYRRPELVHMHQDWGRGLEERPAGVFLSLRRQKTQMAVARAGDQIRWKAPNGWAMSLLMVTGSINWEKEARGKKKKKKVAGGKCRELSICCKWRSRIRLWYLWENIRLCCRCRLKSQTSSGSRLVTMATFIHMNSVRHLK